MKNKNIRNKLSFIVLEKQLQKLRVDKEMSSLFKLFPSAYFEMALREFVNINCNLRNFSVFQLAMYLF